MQLASFIVAVFAAVIALSALAWQARAFVLSGGRVIVEFTAKVVTRTMFTAEFGEPTDLIALLKTFKEPSAARVTFEVTVRNVGRLPVRVKECFIELPTIRSAPSFEISGSMSREGGSHKLDALDAVTWAQDGQMIIFMLLVYPEVAPLLPSLPFRARAVLATGKSAVSKSKNFGQLATVLDATQSTWTLMGLPAE
ncbi:hypothetical protein [Kibdelosporangium phytohabitans]|uniref:Uncharacterized protein n=1 Tax=Kibdelosporangium phytohabitans TaxID=860235 RepID=A0A0N9HVV3_9PSEU|nr:hypothetical protein [Kibdelosporangium phytohabitans]ALG06248.1 hypothetical protein AOZ06_04270 [Kibdelosporangium phytohabitans]MBE1465650.1 hypothetical protein [Kibdelosporangium phytohabitans]